MNVNETVLELYNHLYELQKSGKSTNKENALLRNLSAYLSGQGLRKQMQQAREKAKANIPTIDPLSGKKIENFVNKEPAKVVDPLEAARNYEANGGYKEGAKVELEEIIEEPEETEEGNVLGTSEDKPKRTTRKKQQK